MKRPLSWLIDRFAALAAGEDLRLTVPAEQAAHLRDLLRELRARRIAANREPDDERNAAADIVAPARVCPIPPACTCELVDSSRDELPDGGPCPLSGWVAPRPGDDDGCPVHGKDELHGPLLRCGLFSPDECVFEIACDNCDGIPF